MEPFDPSEAAAVDDLLHRDLAAADGGLVGALDGEGFFTSLPDSVPRGPNQVFLAAHAIEAIHHDDVGRTIEMWEEALTTGFGERELRMANGTEVRVRIYDVRERYGVLVCVAVSLDGRPLDPRVGATDESAQRPRICRLSKDARATIIGVDPAVEPMLGWRPEDLVGRRHLDFVHPDDGPTVVDTWITLLGRPGTPQHLRLRQLCRDGSYMWVEVINHNRLHDPDHGDIVCDIIDISEQVAAEQALREREEMLDKLTQSLPSGVAQFDRRGRLLYSNSRLFDILGTAPVSTVSQLLVHVEAGRHDDLLEGILAVCDEGERHELEADVAAGGSRRRVCQFVVSPLSGGTAGAVLSVTDITDTAERRAELERQAATDPLTQCHNRTAIMEALVEALATAGPDQGVAALFVDLDGFKLVNDALGHAAGDEMLRIVADRLCSATRGGDVVGRVGGDEFLVLHPNVRTHGAAQELAGRLGEALRQPALINDQPVVPSASIGVAWSDGSHDADELVRQADAAMYAVKASRRPGDPHPSTPGSG